MYFGNGSVITFKYLITVVWILETVKMLLFYVNLSKKQQGNFKKKHLFEVNVFYNDCKSYSLAVCNSLCSLNADG